MAQKNTWHQKLRKWHCKSEKKNGKSKKVIIKLCKKLLVKLEVNKVQVGVIEKIEQMNEKKMPQVDKELETIDIGNVLIDQIHVNSQNKLIQSKNLF